MREASKRIVLKPESRPSLCKGSRQREHFRRRSHAYHSRQFISFGYGGREISFVNVLLDVSRYRQRSTKTGNDDSFLFRSYRLTFVHYAFGVMSTGLTVCHVIFHRRAGVVPTREVYENSSDGISRDGRPRGQQTSLATIDYDASGEIGV
jgi:hypothetical protein